MQKHYIVYERRKKSDESVKEITTFREIQLEHS